MSFEGITHWIANWGNTLTFTADNTTDSVAVTLTGTPALGQTTALVYVPQGDNIFIESMALVFPYQYGQGVIPPAVVRLGWIDKSANSGNLTEFGALGEAQIPFVNQICPVNNFIAQPATVANSWGLRILAVSGIWANQFNGPTALNASTQACRFMLRIRHTSQMVS